MGVELREEARRELLGPRVYAVAADKRRPGYWKNRIGR